METKPEAPGVPASLPSNPAVGSQNPPDPASIASTSQTGLSCDWQGEVYQKIKAMKERYLPELNEIYQKVSVKFQQVDAQPRNLVQIEQLRFLMDVLERMIAFLQVSKNDVVPVYKDRLGAYEKQITNVVAAGRPKKPAAAAFYPVEGQDTVIIDSMSQTGLSCDQQEEVYQKIKAMKEMYLPELNELYQKVSAKFYQVDAHLQTPNSVRIKRLRFLKGLLERMINFLQTSKNDVVHVHKDRVRTFEKRIIGVLAASRRKKPALAAAAA